MGVAISFDGFAATCCDVIGDRQFVDGTSDLFFFIEPGVIQNQEDELCPAEVVFVSGRQHAVPVVAEAQAFQLPREIVNVALRLDAWVFAGLDRVFFSRQSERVEAHRVQNAFATKPREPRHNVGRRVAFGVAHMQAIAAGVREHVQHVAFLFSRHLGGRESAIGFPVGLPAGLDFGGVVARHVVEERCRKEKVHESKFYWQILLIGHGPVRWTDLACFMTWLVS